MSKQFYRFIWWLSETLEIPLGRFAPFVFEQMTGLYNYKRKKIR